MKAARMHEYGKAPILEDIPVPDIEPDEILVNVKACGMCRSDGFGILALEVHRLRTVVSPTPVLLISAKRALRRFASLGARSLRT